MLDDHFNGAVNSPVKTCKPWVELEADIAAHALMDGNHNRQAVRYVAMVLVVSD